MTQDLWQRSYPAPAKLNLFLHVVGRRKDGYHLLQTLFRLIELSDTLRFSRRDDDDIRLATQIDGLSQDDDLCVRAAQALRSAPGVGGSGTCTGVNIHLDKRIPMGGGLGGGSSDAATTLLALNRLWGLGMEREELMRIGLVLGADVPFFLLGQNAFGEGVGEVLTPMALPSAWYVVLVPPISVGTAGIFSAPELTRNTKTIKISSFSAGVWSAGQRFDEGSPGSMSLDGISPLKLGRNDLEPVVCKRFPQVAQHLGWLKDHAAEAGGNSARMSGSGACVFAEFATEQQARSVVSSLPAGMRGFATRGLERHPLQELLEQG